MPEIPTDPNRPSDTEAAHAPEEGGAVRDPRLAETPRIDQNHGSLDGRKTKDLDGEAQTGERLGERGHRLGS